MKKIITTTGQYGPYETVEISSDCYVCDGAMLPFSVVGIGTVSAWTGDFPEPEPVIIAPPVPRTISMMQARIILLSAGLLEAVNAVVNNASEVVKISWEYASEVHRNNPIVNQVAEAAGLTQAQLDQLFIDAAQL